MQSLLATWTWIWQNLDESSKVMLRVYINVSPSSRSKTLSRWQKRCRHCRNRPFSGQWRRHARGSIQGPSDKRESLSGWMAESSYIMCLKYTMAKQMSAYSCSRCFHRTCPFKPEDTQVREVPGNVPRWGVRNPLPLLCLFASKPLSWASIETKVVWNHSSHAFCIAWLHWRIDVALARSMTHDRPWPENVWNNRASNKPANQFCAADVPALETNLLASLSPHFLQLPAEAPNPANP